MDDRKMSMDPELGRSLGRIEGKMDMILNSIRDVDRRADALEGRVRLVENHRSKLAGMAAAVGAMAGFLATYIMKVLSI